jgi:transformation/transcription domain-associated protein
MSTIEKAEENSFKGSMNDSIKISFLSMPLSEVERRKNQLLDADFMVGFQVASEINEHLGEISNNTLAFQSFSSLIPILLSVLSRRSRPNPNVDTVESKYRKTILDIFTKLPQNDLLRPHVSHILLTVMDVLKHDYEANGLVAARIVLNLHKNYRPTLADFLQSFFDFMANGYRTLPTNAVQNFDIALNNVVNTSQNSPTPLSLATGMTSMSAPAGPTTATTTFDNTLANSFTTTSVIPMQMSAAAQPSKKIPSFATSKPISVVAPSSEKVSATSMPITVVGQPSTNVSASSYAGLFSLDANPPPHLDGKLNLTARYIKSSASFLVLAECPVIAILIFQSYSKVIPANLSTLLPLMVDGLAVLPPALPVPPASKSSDQLIQQQQTTHKVRIRELVACQVKTLSFLVYLMRGYTDQLQRYEDHICKNVVSLLTTCPIDAIATRRELFVAVRHILATSFRKGFYKYIDALLDDRVLAGGRFSIMHRRNNISEYYATILSPLNYSTLADLVHCVRSRLTLHQHARVIHIFSRVIHDSSLIITIQTMAAKLLLNLVEFIFHSKEVNSNIIGRDLLVRILFTLVMKFGTLREYIPIVAKNQASSVGVGVDRRVELFSDVYPESDLTTEERLLCQIKHNPSSFFIDSVGGTFISGIGGGNAEHKDSIADIQALVAPLFVGLKSLIWCVNNYQAVPPSKHPDPSLSQDETQEVNLAENDDDSKLRITKEELEILSNYVKWGLDCTRNLKTSFMTVENTHTSGTSTQAINDASCFTNDAKSESKHERRCEKYREILDTFARSLSILDGKNLRILITPLLPFLIDYAVSDKDMLVFFRHFFLSSKAASYHICDIVLDHLVININKTLSPPAAIVSQSRPHEVKIRETEESDSKESVVLALFKLVFQSISVFSENETVLRPKLQKIITSSLKIYGKITDWPRFHYALLRALFRTISLGKFEQSYEEIQPIVPAILNGLYRIHCCTENDRLQASVADLCLMIPARLSSLLPHIPLLLRIIVFALQTPYSDLVGLG